MKSIIFLLCFLAVIQLQAQHSIGIGFGEISPRDTSVYTNGYHANLTYRYLFPVGIYAGVQFDMGTMGKANGYSFWTDPVVIAANDNENFRNIRESDKAFIKTSLFTLNYSVKPTIGYAFLHRYRIQPRIELGFSWNRTLQEVTGIGDYGFNWFGPTMVKTARTHWGVFGAALLNVRVSEHANLFGSWGRNYLPNANKGYGRAKMVLDEWSLGYAYSF